jgi:quinol monooxygenase YgiN
MLTVIARIEADAAGIDAMKDAIATMETASRAEPGCVDYTFCTEISNPNVIRVVELWDNMDAVAAHFATPHMATFQAAMAAHPPKGVTAKVYELGQELALPTG